MSVLRKTNWSYLRLKWSHVKDEINNAVIEQALIYYQHRNYFVLYLCSWCVFDVFSLCFWCVFCVFVMCFWWVLVVFWCVFVVFVMCFWCVLMCFVCAFDVFFFFFLCVFYVFFVFLLCVWCVLCCFPSSSCLVYPIFSHSLECHFILPLRYSLTFLYNQHM